MNCNFLRNNTPLFLEDNILKKARRSDEPQKVYIYIYNSVGM